MTTNATGEPQRNRRILLVDDNPSIHEDFRRVLARNDEHQALDAFEADLFGSADASPAAQAYELKSAFQGKDALDDVRAALAEGRPYAMAFVDVRMPPGWDGIETIERIWKEQPDLEVVVCTAYSDYSWEETLARLGHNDRLNNLKKPFDNIEVLQLAHALTEKSHLRKRAERTVADLEAHLKAEVEKGEQRELELRQAQKLEAVGRLASGIAHEINTPIQFVSDSLHFVREAFTDTFPLLDKYQRLRIAVPARAFPVGQLAALEAAEEAADLPYLAENVPKALDRIVEGLERVAAIVRSMKMFAHPGETQKTPTDINEALAATLTIARHEYKYVADVETDFGAIPLVSCHAGEVNQVFLNVIVNAAHAIGDVVAGTPARGTIRVTTRRDEGHVVIAIADTGAGIPEAARAHIFDPFFTTKAVGKGTGQGLAIARNVIVKTHGGTLTFDTEVGRGTTFTICLPIATP